MQWSAIEVVEAGAEVISISSIDSEYDKPLGHTIRGFS